MWNPLQHLATVTPRLVIDAYRDVKSTISGLETIFSIDELLKGLKAGFENFTKLDPVTLGAYRCINISPTVVNSLVDPGLLKKRMTVALEAEDFEEDLGRENLPRL